MPASSGVSARPAARAAASFLRRCFWRFAFFFSRALAVLASRSASSASSSSTRLRRAASAGPSAATGAAATLASVSPLFPPFPSHRARSRCLSRILRRAWRAACAGCTGRGWDGAVCGCVPAATREAQANFGKGTTAYGAASSPSGRVSSQRAARGSRPQDGRQRQRRHARQEARQPYLLVRCARQRAREGGHQRVRHPGRARARRGAPFVRREVRPRPTAALQR